MLSARSISLSVCVPLLILLGWQGTDSSSDDPDPALGVDTTYLDRSTRPQDDFYQYANGRWLQETTIPDDQARWGAYFDLREKTRENVRTVIRTAADADAERGTPSQKVGDFYASFVDTTRRNDLGVAPLQDELRRVEIVKNRADLLRLMAHLQRLPAAAPLEVEVGPDEKAPDRHVASLEQDGLGLPQPRYYEDAKFSDQRAAYREYVATAFRLAGTSDPEQNAERAFALEQRLAERQLSYEKARDARASYNPISWAELQSETGGVDWGPFAEASGLASADTIVVGQPEYVAGLARLVQDASLSHWKAYFQWQFLRAFAPYLGQSFARAHFDFYDGTLRGAEARYPLWKRAVTTTNSSLGELVGRLYVDEHFSPEKKKRAERMVETLREAFHKEISELDWMSNSTKAAAHEKLRAMTAHVAYPDEWRDFSGLRVQPDDLVGNLIRVSRFEYEDALDRLDEPVNKKRWTRAIPQEINGYIVNDRNLITVTAGILQPPFFQADAAPAVNYGGIGAVIGHEISHAFDSQGRKYDHKGRLRDWWTEQDAERYRARTEVLVEQFNQYEPVEGETIDGELTLPENIADLAGVAVAYRAYRLSLDGEPPTIDGFTGDQRFFLGWAQTWRSKIREPALRQMLQRNPHSPMRYRINGIYPHLDSFYEAFDVQPGDGMYRPPETRVEIW